MGQTEFVDDWEGSEGLPSGDETKVVNNASDYRKKRRELYEKEFPGWEIEGDSIGSGSGGTTEVYKIYNKDLDEYEVLKIIKIEKKDDDEEFYLRYDSALDSVKSETKIMYKIQNRTSGVVRCFDGFHTVDWKEQNTSGRDLLIRMEYLPYNLAEIIKKNAALEKYFSEREIIKLGMDLCRALYVCHSGVSVDSNGNKVSEPVVIHRDIKPGNIYRDAKGQYKLGDFGISRILSEVGTRKDIAYTPYYAAPEQQVGEATPAVDIYCLGLTLYQLSNYYLLPFVDNKNASDEEIRNAVKKRLSGKTPIPDPQGIKNPRLKKIILQACSYQKELRYKNTRELWLALKECLPERKEDKKNKCGAGSEFELNEINGTLLIKGRGKIERQFSSEAWSDKIKKIVINEGITEIGEDVFSNCRNLKEVITAGSVITIGARAFKACGKLEKAVFKEGLKEIGFWAFQRCHSLKELYLPLDIDVVHRLAFDECTGLQRVMVNADSIESYAFRDCANLQELYLSVKDLSNDIVLGTQRLSKVFFIEQIPELDTDTFTGFAGNIYYSGRISNTDRRKIQEKWILSNGDMEEQWYQTYSGIQRKPIVITQHPYDTNHQQDLDAPENSTGKPDQQNTEKKLVMETLKKAQAIMKKPDKGENDFRKISDLAKEALRIDQQNGMAYYLLFLSRYNVDSIEALPDDSDWIADREGQLVLRYNNGTLKKRFEKRIQDYQKEQTYKEAARFMTLHHYQNAKDLYTGLDNYKDSRRKAEECHKELLQQGKRKSYEIEIVHPESYLHDRIKRDYPKEYNEYFRLKNSMGSQSGGFIKTKGKLFFILALLSILICMLEFYNYDWGIIAMIPLCFVVYNFTSYKNIRRILIGYFIVAGFYITGYSSGYTFVAVIPPVLSIAFFAIASVNQIKEYNSNGLLDKKTKYYERVIRPIEEQIREELIKKYVDVIEENEIRQLCSMEKYIDITEV